MEHARDTFISSRAERRRQHNILKKEDRVQSKSRCPERNHTSPAIRATLDRATALISSAHHQEARTLLQPIVQTAPTQPNANLLLGIISHLKGEKRKAINFFKAAISAKRDFAEAHNNLGLVYKSLGKFDQSKSSFQTAISIAPNYAEAHNNMGNLLAGLGAWSEAVAIYQRAITIAPDDASAHNNLGNTFQRLDRYDDAEASFKKSIAIRPNDARTHRNLGLLLTKFGRFDEAIARYRMAIALDPNHTDTYRQLANIKKFTKYDDDVCAMKKLYSTSGISTEQRMHLAFALGKAFEELKRHEEAFEYFAVGARIKRNSFKYAVNDDDMFFKKLKETFSAKFVADREGGGCPDESPIFILGMPRSGTTLVEQILASHPQVHGGGELDTLKQITTSYSDRKNRRTFPEYIEHFSSGELGELGHEYIRNIRRLNSTDRFITNKMPGNFRFIGLIKLILPKAKIIHCQRDAADNCLSLFRNYFTDTHNYSYDLDELGMYYGLYRRLMGHWNRVFPGGIHTIQYEDLVTNQAEQTRALLEFCKLEWNDECLEFHKTDRPVMTASSKQVRRPIYDSSLRSWTRYKDQLTPLLKHLHQDHLQSKDG